MGLIPACAAAEFLPLGGGASATATAMAVGARAGSSSTLMPEATSAPAATDANGSFGQLFSAQIALAPASAPAPAPAAVPELAAVVAPVVVVTAEPMSAAPLPIDSPPLVSPPSLVGLAAEFARSSLVDSVVVPVVDSAIPEKTLAPDTLPVSTVLTVPAVPAVPVVQTAPVVEEAISVPMVPGVALVPAETEAPAPSSSSQPVVEDSKGSDAPAPRRPVALVSTLVPASVSATSSTPVRDASLAPGLMDIIALGLALTLPSKDEAIPAPNAAASAVVGLEQLPRNGRPVQATPDRESYFVALPPSPAAETHASLVQALTIPLASSAQAPSPAQVSILTQVQVPAQPEVAVQAGLTIDVPRAPLPERRLSVSTVSTTLIDVATTGNAPATVDADMPSIPVQFLTASSVQMSSAPSSSAPVDTAVEAISVEVAPTVTAVRQRPAVPVPQHSNGKGQIEAETAPALILSEAVPRAAGLPVESPRKKTPLESTTDEADVDVTAPAAVAVAAPALVAYSPVAPASVAAANPRPLSPPASSAALLVAASALPGGSAGSQALGSEKASGKADALATTDLATTDLATTRPSANVTPEPATTIPFATSMASATGTSTSTPATLPNPVERSIVRQLSQQLAAPLATLTPPGHEHKSAADKNLVIRLTPPELGTVRVEMSQRDGQLVIRMYAEDPAVRQAIERMLPNLRSDLRQGDGQAQVITVESSSSERNGDRDGQRHGERSPDDRGAWQGQQQQQQRHERAYSGGHSARGSERPQFSLQGQPAVEPITVVPRPRSLGSRSPAGSVDALA